jgi:hypothetical protein
MTRQANPSVSAAPAPTREPRPFSFLVPRLVIAEPPAIDAGGRAFLAAKTTEFVPALVRALVDHTIALQNRRALESGNRQPIQLSVLNRRRRSARSWIQAVINGAVDLPTLHSVATQWLPMLAGHSPAPEVQLRLARSCVEFVRGALTGLIFDQAAENLLGHARAQHALETVLAAHLAAVEEALRG